MASREVLDDDAGFRGGSCPDKECGECGDQAAPPRERDGSRAREGEEQDRRGRETERGALERRELAVRETNADEVETSEHDGHEERGEGDPVASHYSRGASHALNARRS